MQVLGSGWRRYRRANKNSIKIIGDHTDKYVQAYFQYDSKKTGGVTVSHLRFGDSPIRSPYYVTKADFVACHNPSYIVKGFKMVRDVKPGGTFLVNCQWSDEEFAEHMPAVAKRYIANNNVNVYLIDAIDLAAKVGMGKRTNTVLQSAFFALAKVLPAEDALQYMKDAATKSYMKKGQAIVDANHKAIDAGATAFHKFEVPADWATAEDAAPVELSEETKSAIAQQVKNLLEPIDRMDGDSCPFPPLSIAPTASLSWAPPHTRSAASPWSFLTGTRPSASSATSAPMCARMPPSVRSR